MSSKRVEWVFSLPDWQRLQEDRPRGKGGAMRVLPWAKVRHDFVLDNVAFRKLTKAQRADWLDLLALARRFNNEVPEDPEELSFILRTTELPDFNALIKAGLLIRRKKPKAYGQQSGRESGQESDGQEAGPDTSGLEASGPEKEPRLESEKRKNARESDLGITQEPTLIPCDDGGVLEVDRVILGHLQKKFSGVDVQAELRALVVKISAGEIKPAVRRTALSGIEGWLEQAARYSNGRSAG